MKNTTKNIVSILVIVGVVTSFIMTIIKFGAGNDLPNPYMEGAEQISSFSQNIVSQVRHGDFAALSKYYDENFSEKDANYIVELAKLNLPTQSPTNVELIGLTKMYRYDKNHNKSYRNMVVLQYQFSQEWYQVDVAYIQEGNKTHLISFHINKLANSYQNINKVVFSKASALQYFVLFITMIVPVIILCALILCIRTSNIKRKWLWIIFIISGFMGVSFNWTTQEFVIHPLTWQLFGSELFRESRYEALILSSSIPLGAIIFLIKHVFSRGGKVRNV